MDKPSSFGDLVREMGLFDSGTKRVRHPSAEAPPAPHGLLPPEGAASEQTDPPAVYRRNGISEKHLRRYRRWPTEDTLDLHGLTVLQAHREIENFLAKSLSRRWQKVEIIHGIGSQSGGILRGKARFWLAACPVVLAFFEPRNNSGSILVILQKP